MDRIMEQLSKLQELSNEELTELEELALSEFETTQGAELSSETVAAMTKLADAVEAVRTEQARRVTEAAALEEAAAEAAARVKPADASTQEPEPGEEPEVTDPAITPEEQDENESKKDDDDEEPDDEPAKVNPAELSVETPKAAEASEQTPEPAPTAPPEPDELPEPAPADPPAEPAAPAEPAPATTAEASVEAPAEAEASEAPAEEPETKADAEASTKENPDKVQEDNVTADAAPQGTGDLAIEAPAGRQPQIKPATTLSITAGADVPGYSAGVQLKDTNEVADAFMRRLHSLRHVHGGDGEQHIVASLRQEFPSDRNLSANDPLENTSKIQGVTSPEAIIAAAGVCLPLETRYDLGCDVGVTDRPVRDALARFGADRGGIRFFSAPTLADQGDTAYSNATGYWRPGDRTPGETGVTYTAQNWDGSAADGGNKPCLEVQCTSEQEALIEAVTLCLTFNNLTTRTFPELIKRHNELALVQHARIAENNLLAQIEAGSTRVAAGAQVVGATREIMNLLAKAVAAYRFRHRMNTSAPLRMIAPSWVLELLRADLALQMPGDGFDVFDMAEARINAWFRSRGVNITWHLDGAAGPAIGDGTAQDPDETPDTGDEFTLYGGFEFPGTIEFALFAEGTWLYLDGGTLDLGVIRDSSLVATNQYKQFVETFEGVANVGCDSYWVTADYEPTGAAAALVGV